MRTTLLAVLVLSASSCFSTTTLASTPAPVDDPVQAQEPQDRLPRSHVDELDDIARVMQVYIDGARSGRSADLKAAFHDDATIQGYVGPNLFGGPIQKFYDWHDRNGPAPGIQSRITRIDVVGSAASVRIDTDNWTGYRFTDFLNLVKIDGEWKITNNIFFLHP